MAWNNDYFKNKSMKSAVSYPEDHEFKLIDHLILFAFILTF